MGTFKKNAKLKSYKHKIKEHTFLNRIEKLFDISGCNPKHNLTEAQLKFLKETWKPSSRKPIFLSSLNAKNDISRITIKSDLDVKPNDNSAGNYNMI